MSVRLRFAWIKVPYGGILNGSIGVNVLADRSGAWLTISLLLFQVTLFVGKIVGRAEPGQFVPGAITHIGGKPISEMTHAEAIETVKGLAYAMAKLKPEDCTVTKR